MIANLVNMLNVANYRKQPVIVKFSKYTIRILEKLKQLEVVDSITVLSEKEGIRCCLVEDKVNKFGYFTPINRGYSKKQLVVLNTRMKKLYSGTILVSSNQGLRTDAVVGGKIILYVY